MAAKPRVLAERYRLGKVLGSGAWATVYRARDLRDSRDVAVKVLGAHLRGRSRSVERFLAEGRLLMRVGHPHVVRVLDVGQSARSLFIAMELMERRTLAEEIEKRAPLPVERALDMAMQVCDGLAAAHDRGLIHRDLKPANLLLLPHRDPFVKIADFGIALSLVGETIEEARDALIGTPVYMSPEQAAGEDIDERSDLYSLGLILYEMLSGKPPFPREAIWRRCHEDAPDIRTAHPDLRLPQGLAEVLLQLLARRREHRPRNAREARALLAAFVTGQETSHAAEPVDVAGTHYGSLDLSPSLCGRDPEVARLQAIVERLGEFPNATLVLLSGPSGMGKTHLARHVASIAADRALCHSHECQFGPLPLREVAATIEDCLGTRDVADDVLAAHLGRIGSHEAHDLARVLRPAGEEHPSTPGEAEAHGDYQCQMALDMLAHCAERRSICLVLDDLHRADALTQKMIARLPLWSRDRGRGLLVLATWTGSLDPALAPAPRFAERAFELSLGALSEQDSDTLLSAMGPLDRDARAFIADLSAGNPLHAIQLVRHMRDTKLLEPTRQGWRLSPGARLALSAPPAAEDLVGFRVDALNRATSAGPPAIELVERAALVGSRMSVDLLADVLAREGRQDLRDGMPALLDLLAKAEFIRLSDENVLFGHKLVQQALAARIASRPEAPPIQRAIAEAMMAAGSPDQTGIAAHCLRGEVPERAVPIALRSAAARRSLGDIPGACEDYRLALRALDARKEPDPPPRLTAELGLGEMLLLLGRNGEAQEHFLRALDIEQVAEALEGFGRAAEAKGDYEMALDHLGRAETKYRGAGRGREAAQTLLSVGRVHERQGRFAEARRRRQEALAEFESLGDRLGAAEVRMALGHQAAFTREIDEGLEMLERALEDLDRGGSLFRRAHCMNMIASLNAERDELERALSMQEEVRKLCEREGHTRHVAACLDAQGTLLALLGRAEEGRQILEAALRLREDMDDTYGIGASQVNLAMACRMAGRLADAVEWARGSIEHAKQTESPSLEIYARSELGRALALTGALEEAEALLDCCIREAAELPKVRADCLEGLADVAWARGEHETARRRWREAAELFSAVGSPRLAEAARSRAERCR